MIRISRVYTLPVAFVFSDIFSVICFAKIHTVVCFLIAHKILPLENKKCHRQAIRFSLRRVYPIVQIEIAKPSWGKRRQVPPRDPSWGSWLYQVYINLLVCRRMNIYNNDYVNASHLLVYSNTGFEDAMRLWYYLGGGGWIGITHACKNIILVTCTDTYIWFEVRDVLMNRACSTRPDFRTSMGVSRAPRSIDRSQKWPMANGSVKEHPEVGQN